MMPYRFSCSAATMQAGTLGAQLAGLTQMKVKTNEATQLRMKGVRCLQIRVGNCDE